MQSEDYLKANELRRIWKEGFLPGIRQEIKLELQTLKASIDLLTDRCNTLENSQQFLSNKYDMVVQTLQNVKEQEITNTLKQAMDKKMVTCGVSFDFSKAFETITCGIPQGSTLGPLPFVLLITDLPNVPKKKSFPTFTDDINMFFFN